MPNLTRYVASYYSRHGVRFNLISPGGLLADQEKEFVKRYNQRTFLGRMTNESDLKGAAVFTSLRRLKLCHGG